MFDLDEMRRWDEGLERLGEAMSFEQSKHQRSLPETGNRRAPKIADVPAQGREVAA